MDATFMNSGNSKIFDPYRLLFNLLDKIDLKRSDKHVVIPNLNICYAWKHIKRSYKSNKSKISGPT